MLCEKDNSSFTKVHCFCRVIRLASSVRKKKSECACALDSVKDLVTCPNQDTFVPIMQHFHFETICPLDIELENVSCIV